MQKGTRVCDSCLQMNIFMPKVRVTPIIGLPQFNGWSQVVESPPHSSVKTVLSVAIEGTQAGNVGRDIANYFSAQVVQTLEEFHLLLEEIINQAIENDVRILCSAGYFSGENCAYATFNGAVLLKRNDKIGTILSSGNQLKLITGKVSLQDAVVFSTLPSASFFSEIELKFEQGYDIDTIVTSVVPGLHSEENSSLSSLAFVTFEEYSQKEARLVQAEKVQPHISPSSEYASKSAEVSGQSTVLHQAASSERQTESPIPNKQNPLADTSDARDSGTESSEDTLVASSLAASLEEPVKPESGKGFDFVAILSTIVSKIGAVLKIVAAAVSVVFRRARPVLVSFAGTLSSGGKNAFQKMKSGGKGLDVTAAIGDTGKAFRSMLPNHDVYIETADSKKIRNIRIAVVVISVLLVVGIGMVLFVSKRNAERDAAQTALAPYASRVEEVQRRVDSDPVAAREEVQAILRELEDLQAEQESNSLFYDIVSARREEIESLYQEISGRDELQELPVFYDLRLVSSDFIASKVLRQGQTLYFFDIEQKTLVTLESNSKRAGKFDVSVDTIRDAVMFDEAPLVLTQAGIGSLSISEESVNFEEVIAEGDSNREATLVASFDPYVYVVNPEKRNIYRYADSDEGFSDPIGWIQSVAQGLDFASISSIAIDGDVWLGTKTGELFKFTRGSAQDFEIRGLDTPFNSTVFVHTSSESDRLFILEPQNSRIVILQKNGDFIKEISNTSLGSVTDIVADETESALYAVSGSVVFKLDI